MTLDEPVVAEASARVPSQPQTLTATSEWMERRRITLMREAWMRSLRFQGFAAGGETLPKAQTAAGSEP